jgi:RND family efflux transporter MFP subunit
LDGDDPLESLDPEHVPSVLLEKAVYEEARQNLLRLRRLRESNAVSQAELDSQYSLERVAAARYEAALNGVYEKLALVKVYRAALALAQQNRHDAIIRAPFDGVVQQRHVAAGAYVQPAAPIITLVRTHPLRYRCMVPERRAHRVRENQTIRIYLNGRESPLETRIVRVSPSLDTASRSLVVEAEVPNSDGQYRAGMFAEAEVVVDPEATTLSVPAEAVGEFAGVTKVWLLRDGVLQQQVVEIGRRDDQRFEILSGIAEADRIAGVFTEGQPGATADTVQPLSSQPDPAAGRRST